ncbi:DEAD/DEAH box helicase [Actinomyces sp. W5033]|uniref:DEAD/DEAH box helicase n=1 Tax=Actinomyces sp. W5033 TaxID=3446479 RepID=UPI003EE127AF
MRGSEPPGPETGPTPPGDGRPLRRLRLGASLRPYQRELLDAVEPQDGARLHLVAPPGAGKTLLGLELARRNGRRALVLAPTTLIRDQWAAQARRFLRPDDAGPPEHTACLTKAAGLAEDAAPEGLTVLTYQSLTVVDGAGPWQDAARRRWAAERVEEGMSAGAAEGWLSRLEAEHPAAWRRGVAARAGRLRSHVDELDDTAVESLLAPGARRRLDALVRSGTATVVLDECHHLTAHWAVVVQYLLRRLSAAGAAPTLIGLTATQPSTEDSSWSRYHALLGDVDAEIPLPAVVRAGHLAPARSLVWFTTPTAQETAFLEARGAELRARVAQTLLAPDGIDFLLDLVAPVPEGRAPGQAGHAAPASGAVQRAGAPVPASREEVLARLAAGIDADPVLATAAAAVLRRTGTYTPTALSVLVVPELPDVGSLGLEDELRLVGRYALERVLPDPSRRGEWQGLRDLLGGLGVSLTDSGLRAGRSPLDLIAASTRAKDTAVVEVLRAELDALGERLCAVVVTDAAERSATHKALDVLAGAHSGRPVGGVLRCLETVLTDQRLRALHPVALTSSHLRLASGEESLLERLRTETGLPLSVTDDGWTTRVTAPAGRASGLVLAVCRLVAAGQVRLVLGTRGLLGEGWDCPQVNTLVDLTTATTATAVCQLRGRTVRLDPAWPGKVAHTWSLACLLPTEAGLAQQPDLARLERKLDHQWSLRVQDPGAGDGSGRPALITTGPAGVLEPEQVAVLDALAGAAPQRAPLGTAAAVARLNAGTVASLSDRAGERQAWLAGAGAAHAAGSGATGSEDGLRPGTAVEAVEIRLRPGLLRRGTPEGLWTALVRVVAEVLAERTGAPLEEGQVVSLTDRDAVVVGLAGVEQRHAQAVAEAVAALLGPAATAPRFVLEVATGSWSRRAGSRLGVLRRLLSRLEAALWRGPDRVIMLAVPASLVRSRTQAVALVDAWSRLIGPCRLRLVRDEGDAAALLGACASTRGVSVSRLRWWVEGPQPAGRLSAPEGR